MKCNIDIEFDDTDDPDEIEFRENFVAPFVEYAKSIPIAINAIGIDSYLNTFALGAEGVLKAINRYGEDRVMKWLRFLAEDDGVIIEGIEEDE